MGNLKLYQRAQGFRCLSFGLAALFCGLLAQPLLVIFCLLWPLLLHQWLPDQVWVLSMAQRYGWRLLLAVVHLLEAAIVAALFITVQLSLVPVLCTLLALLVAAIAQGGLLLCTGVLLIIATTMLLLNVGYLLPAVGAVDLPSAVAVAMCSALTLALAHAGFGRAIHLHRSRRRWQHQGQRYQLLSDRLSRYVPAPVLQRLAQLGSNHSDAQWQAPLNWQRRWLTLVMVDLVGFTELSRHLPAEHCALVLNRFLLVLDQLAVEHNAGLAQFMGDGALLVWGDPASEPPLEQILHACDLCNQLPAELLATDAFCASQGAPVQLRARAAITSGYCTVGDWGQERLDYTLIGPCVNLAQRLQQCAPANGALLDDASAAIVSGSAKRTAACVYTERVGAAQWFDLKGFGRVRAHGLVPQAAG